MILAIVLVLGASVLVYYIIYKMWSSGVKTVGRKILDVVKPIYKFIFRVFPITIVVITVMSIVLTVLSVISVVKGNDEKNDKDENKVVIEEIDDKENVSFFDKFIDRALNRTENFTNGLLEKIESFNRLIGVDENGESSETSEFGIKYMLVVAYGIILLVLIPFIIILLIIVIAFVMMLELLAATFIIDTVILIIRLVFAENAVEKVKYWWEWARA